jgi:enamine deaminase RidA (YjgF/YER057c/UK114 family)
MGAESRLRELGITLPPVQKAAGTYLRAVRTGNLLFVAGHGPIRADGSIIVGKLGRDLESDAGYEAARVTGLAVLATIRDALGSLDAVTKFVRVGGFVNATPDFKEHPKVVNGASDLFVEVFGDAGRHARVAVGYASLPFNIAVEIEAVVEV